MNDNAFFVTGGTLPLGASSYVTRQADLDLYDALKQGQYCYLLNTRQMGKSSLVVRTAERLRRDIGASVAIFELSAIGQNVTPAQLYYGLCNLLGQQLGLEDELDEYWFENEKLSPMQRFFESIRQVILPEVLGPLIIVVDEVDVLRTVQQHFSTDEFFGGIRDCHNRRVTQPEFQRLTFCLVGVATPSDLIQDTRVSPFNIGRRIVITDFTAMEADCLSIGLGPNGRQLLSRVLYWTGGHPYLTQRLCHELERQGTSQVRDVDQQCERLFLSKTARESDNNLTFVRDRLLRSGEHRVEDMLDLYSQVRAGRPVFDDDVNPLYSTLRLSGVVKVVDSHGRLAVRNRIYERVFDHGFIRNNMPDAERRRQEAAARRGRFQVGAIASAVIFALSLMLWFTMQANYKAEEVARSEKQANYRANLEASRATRALQELSTKSGTLNDVEASLRRAKQDLTDFREQLKRVARQKAEAAKGITAARQQLAEANRRSAIAQSRQREAEIQQRKKELEAKAAEKRARIAEESTKAAQIITQAAAENRRAAQQQADAARKAADKAQEEARTAKSQAVAAEQAAKDQEKKVQEAVAQVERLTMEAERQRKIRDQQQYIYRIAAAQNELESSNTYAPMANETDTPLAGNIVRAEDELKKAKALADTPGFEWYFLNRLCHTESVLTKVPLAGGFSALAFAPQDNTLIAANTLGLIHYTRNGQSYTFNSARFRTVALSSDGEYLSGGDSKGNLTIWNTSRISPLLSYSAGQTAVTACAISSRRNPVFLAATAAGRIVACNLRGDTVGRITLDKNVKSRIRAVTLDEPGERALVATEKQTALYNVASGRRLMILNGAPGNITGAAFFPGGGQIALITQDNQFLIFDVATGSLLGRETIDARVKNPQSIAFASQGTAVAVGGNTADVAQIRLRAPDPFQRPGEVLSLAFTPDCQDVAVARNAGGVQIPRNLDLDNYLLAHARATGTCTAFSADRNCIAIGCRDGAVEMFDKRVPGRLSSLASAGASPVTRLVFSPDGKRLAAGRRNGSVTVWDLGPQRRARSFQPHTSAIALIAFLPGDRLITAAPGDVVRVHSVDGVKMGAFAVEEDGRFVTTAAVSENGKYLAVGQGYSVVLYDTETGKPYVTCTGHINDVSSLAFSSDGTRLVSGSYDGKVILWDVATGESVLTLRGNRYWNDSGHVSAVAFAPNGKAIAVGTETGKAIVLHAEDE